MLDTVVKAESNRQFEDMFWLNNQMFNFLNDI